MKRQVYADVNVNVVEATDRSLPLMAASLRAEDFREGVKSFLEKRPPNFAPLDRPPSNRLGRPGVPA